MPCSTLDADGCGVFVEVGPHPVLTGLGQRCMPAERLDGQLWAAPLRRGADDRAETMSSLAALYLRGLNLDWAPVHADVAGPARRPADLPVGTGAVLVQAQRLPGRHRPA